MAETKPFKEIVLAEWMPALITALIGGLLVAYLAPTLQTRFTELSVQKKRRLDLWESIGDNFTQYILWRGRLNSIAKTEQSYIKNRHKLPKDLQDRRERYVNERDKYINLIRRDLFFANYYFSDNDVKNKIEGFLQWHTKFSEAKVDQLPADKEYYDWRNSIMEAIKRHL